VLRLLRTLRQRFSIQGAEAPLHGAKQAHQTSTSAEPLPPLLPGKGLHQAKPPTWA